MRAGLAALAALTGTMSMMVGSVSTCDRSSAAEWKTNEILRQHS